MNRYDAPPTPKRDIQQSLQQNTQSFSDGLNPIDPIFEPHRYRLMESAVSRLSSDVFEEKYWQPFIKSLRKYERSIRYGLKQGKTKTSSAGIWEVKNGKLLGRSGTHTKCFYSRDG